METNKFTKEQFLLLAECEYVIVNAMTNDCVRVIITENLKKEVLQLTERLHNLLPDITEIAIRQMEIVEDDLSPISMEEFSELAIIHFLAATSSNGTTTKAAIYPILYLAKKFK